MKREFSKLGTEASIKNTLPPVNNTEDNNQAIVPYRSRTGTIVVGPQEEFDFEVSSSGKAIYYMKQERENLKTQNLYEDQYSPVGKQYIYEKGEDSDVEFVTAYMEGVMFHVVNEGDELQVGTQYSILKNSVMPLQDFVDVYVNGSLVAENTKSYIFIFEEDMSVNNKVVITVKRHDENKYLTVVNNSSPMVNVLCNGESLGTVPTGTSKRFEILPGEENLYRIQGMIFGATYNGTYHRKDKYGVTLGVPGNAMVESPNGESDWYFYSDDEGILITQ